MSSIELKSLSEVVDRNPVLVVTTDRLSYAYISINVDIRCLEA